MASGVGWFRRQSAGLSSAMWLPCILYLLTTTAQDVFAAMGDVQCDRRQVPLPVGTSSQFESLCPSGAVCMSKRL